MSIFWRGEAVGPGRPHDVSGSVSRGFRTLRRRTDTMTTQLPLKPDYQAARAQLEGAISKKLAMVEDKTLASLPRYVADDMRGGYVRDVAVLLSPFTPDYYAECVEGFDGDAADHAFLDFCIQELNEYHAYLALVAWPNAVGRDYAWPALSFPLEQRWADKVSILEEARYPEILEYCVEELSDKHDKEQVEAWVKEFGVKRIAGIASGHAQVKEGVKNKDPYFETLYEMDLTPVSELVEAFERQFSQDEAEAVVAGFGGDVRRASQLYRELTHDYAGSMTVEDIINAGKDGHDD